jgi:hypothetical protein
MQCKPAWQCASVVRSRCMVVRWTAERKPAAPAPSGAAGMPFTVALATAAIPLQQ